MKSSPRRPSCDTTACVRRHVLARVVEAVHCEPAAAWPPFADEVAMELCGLRLRELLVDHPVAARLQVVRHCSVVGPGCPAEPVTRGISLVTVDVGPDLVRAIVGRRVDLEPVPAVRAGDVVVDVLLEPAVGDL